MIFAPFYTLAPAGSTSGLPADGRLASETEQLTRFFGDYAAARHPVSAPSEVVPMRLTLAEIDALLEQIELWNLRR